MALPAITNASLPPEAQKLPDKQKKLVTILASGVYKSLADAGKQAGFSEASCRDWVYKAVASNGVQLALHALREQQSDKARTVVQRLQRILDTAVGRLERKINGDSDLALETWGALVKLAADAAEKAHNLAVLTGVDTEAESYKRRQALPAKANQRAMRIGAYAKLRAERGPGFTGLLESITG